MAEVFGFDKDGVRRTAETNRRVLGTLPPLGRRTRRVYRGTSSSSGGDGGGGGGCSCCSCTDCINICDQDIDSVVTTCANCTTAPNKYQVDLGSVLGVRTFVHTSSCTWETSPFEVSYVYPTGAGGGGGSFYKATLTQNGNSSTLVVTHTSGTDDLKLTTSRQLKWKADPDKNWSCTCNSSMIPDVAPDLFPPNAGIRCEICVAPMDTLPTGAACTYLEDHGLCVNSLTMNAVDLSASGGDTGCTSGTITASALTGSGVDEPCCFDLAGDGGILGYLAFACSPSGGYLHVYAHVCVNSSTGILGVLVTLEEGFVSANYVFTGTYVSSIPVQVGANTLTFVSSTATGPGGGAITDGVWPGSLTITTTDCTYGSTHPDVGYGCGGSGGGGTSCGGFGCQYVAYDSTGAQGGAVGPWTWGGCSPSPCPGGCSVPGPPGSPPTSGGDTYSVSCA